MNKWKRVKVEQLEARDIESFEAIEAIKKHHGQRIYDFDYFFLKYRPTGTIAIYELDDGRCMLIDEEYEYLCEHWPSRQALAENVQKRNDDPSGEVTWLDPLKEAPLGDDFFEKIPELIASLPSLLSMEANTLDGTLESLKHIDTVLSELDITHQELANLFPHLVAYCGDIIMRHTNGQWIKKVWEPSGKTVEHIIAINHGNGIEAYITAHTKADSSSYRKEDFDEDRWIPYILASNGKLLNTWGPVYRTLFNIDHDLSTLYDETYTKMYGWGTPEIGSK